MDKLITTALGGHPLVLNDFRWFLGQIAAGNDGIYQAFNNLLRGFGDNFIVQGVVASGTTPNIAITEGWIMLAGELLKVDAQTGIDTSTEDSFTKVSTFDSTGDKTYLNGATVQTYQKNRGVVNSLVGTLAYNGTPIFKTDYLDDAGADTFVVLRKKIIEIGDWNMDTTSSVQINHEISDITKIRSVTAMVRNDGNNAHYPLDRVQGDVIQGGIDSISTTQVTLERLGAGAFDTGTFSTTPFNRGWITIEFEF